VRHPDQLAAAVRRRALLVLADIAILGSLWPLAAHLVGGDTTPDALIVLGLLPTLCLTRQWCRVGDLAREPGWLRRAFPAFGMVAGGFCFLVIALLIARSLFGGSHGLLSLLLWVIGAGVWILTSRWFPTPGGDQMRKRIAFAGHPESVARVRERLRGMIADSESISVEWGESPPPEAALDALDQAVAGGEIDEVLLCTDIADRATIARVLGRLYLRATPVLLVPDFADVSLFCLQTGDMAGLPVLHLSDSPLTEGAMTIKWIEDKVLGLLFAAISAPVMVVVALAVKLTSPGPVLFIQERHGLNGRIIKVYKFRTMRADMLPAPGEASTSGSGETTKFFRKPAALTGSGSGSDFRQATAGDPRVTRLGRFLRNTSLDELPQFINVLQGRMSIVGPRPHPIKLNHQFADEIVELMRRHYVKPGITGLAQISGARGETRGVDAMRRRVEFDLTYIRTWSLWLDLRIITWTVFKGFINHQP
jgi:putative colanic acid biosysnthesis UDP-glucose lipid carrier transferase